MRVSQCGLHRNATAAEAALKAGNLSIVLSSWRAPAVTRTIGASLWTSRRWTALRLDDFRSEFDRIRVRALPPIGAHRSAKRQLPDAKSAIVTATPGRSGDWSLFTVEP